MMNFAKSPTMHLLNAQYYFYFCDKPHLVKASLTKCEKFSPDMDEEYAVFLLSNKLEVRRLCVPLFRNA